MTRRLFVLLAFAIVLWRCSASPWPRREPPQQVPALMNPWAE
ncbi:MAG TPA: hypothetical protein VGR02_17795 [Thermoanaerobaculia bacterium]|jgi:hypothetical protein|nr:hypothetical protein [Thermoanaerobaculia bacterium]